MARYRGQGDTGYRENGALARRRLHTGSSEKKNGGLEKGKMVEIERHETSVSSAGIALHRCPRPHMLGRRELPRKRRGKPRIELCELNNSKEFYSQTF